MEYRPFGRTGLQVSAIGYGCWEVGGGYGQVEEAAFARAVATALDVGINCFDTAEGYGMGASERALGQALGRRRDEAIVVSKFGMNYRDKPSLRDSSRARVMASIEASLKNLGTDWVDVYLVHWPDRETPFEETMSALEDVVLDGKARFVGLSNFKREEIEACAGTRRVDVVQYGWNMFDRRMQREILPYCQEQGIGFMAYGSLAYGLLTGTFTEHMDFGAEDWRARQGKMGSIKLFDSLFGPESFPRNVRAVEELKAIAARYDRTLPQLALRWAISNPLISTALVGCRTVAEVEDNVGAIGWSIAEEDLDAIDAVFARHGVEHVHRATGSKRTDRRGGYRRMGVELAGKIAIVTGGAGGLGRGIVELLVAEGAQVVIADLDTERGELLAAGLGAAAAFKRTDVGDADDVQQLVDFAVARFGGLQIMCNNAGISGPGRRFLEDDLGDFDALMRVNVFGVMIGCQRAARHMANHGGGSIINTTSIGGINAGGGLMTYRAGKAAVVHLTKCARDRPGRTRDPGQLRSAGPHPDGHQCCLRPESDRTPDAAAAARRVARRRSQRRALSGERPVGAGHRDRPARRWRDDRGAAHGQRQGRRCRA